MKLRARTFALILAAASLVGGAAVLSTRSPAEAPSPWRADTVSAYKVEWRTRAVATVAAEGKAQLGSDVSASGELLVRSYGERDGRTLLGVRWGKVDSARLEAVGREVTAGPELARQLEEADALIAVSPSGQVEDVRFSAATTPLARGVLRAVVLEVCAQIAAASGEGEVDTALGHAHVKRTADGRTVSTERSRYDSLEALPDEDPLGEVLSARGSVERDDTSGVTAIKSTEDLSAEGRGPVEAFHAKTELTASLLSRKKEAIGAPPSYAAAPLRSRLKEGNDYDRRASLERRSVGVTYESLYADVRMASVLPKAGATAWIWHDSAFLELHPEDAAKLLDQASRELDLTGQAAALDIVVVSGTPEAQRAAAEALRTWAAKDDASYVALVQRIGYLRHPSPDTLAFAEAEYLRQKGTERGDACAYMLGALAAAAREGQPDRAQAIVARLVADLASAAGDSREALIRGLGNAGFESALSAITAHKAAKDASVRAAVASAMRKMEGHAAVDALLELVVDEDAVVASTALGSLFRKHLDDDAWARLQRAAAEERIPEGAQSDLVNGLAARRAETPRAAAILVAMVAAPNLHPKTRMRVESVLRQ